MIKKVMITTQSLKKSYTRGEETVHALKGVDLELKSGEFVSIMGPSGSGKSTLLHLMGGLDRPTSGSILIDQVSLQTLSDAELSLFRRRKLGFIFQFFNLLPTLSAIENVTLPMMLDDQPFSKLEPRARELLKMMGIEKRMHHTPDQLSGGEMQRVAIARALMSDPVLILADEPTGNLDSKTGDSVLKLLSEMVQETKKTILMVTHDEKAASIATRRIRVRDGLIESDLKI